MKFNKKLIVPFLSTVVGLSISGGLGGAFAWYQYNTQVTASFVGTSVADSSVLQIGHYEEVQGVQTMVWGKDFYPYASGSKQKMIPVTFGQTVTKSNKENCLDTEYAFGYPEARVSGDVQNPGYDESWSHILANQGFVRFDLYLRVLKADGSLAPSVKIYMKDILIEAAAEANGNKDITNAFRVHLDVEGGANRLIGKNAETINLYGPLDLDGVGGNDTTGGYVPGTGIHPTGTEITYGRLNETQTTIAADNSADGIVATRGSDGKYPESQNGKVICTTDGIAANKITVTVWLEGWAALRTSLTDTSETSSVWNPVLSAGVDIRFGMTFDTGVIRTA